MPKFMGGCVKARTQIFSHISGQGKGCRFLDAKIKHALGSKIFFDPPVNIYLQDELFSGAAAPSAGSK